MTALRRAAEEKQRRDAESSAQLSERLEVLQTQLVKAEEEASIDPLTKVANRGTFNHVFARMMDHARMTKQPLSLAMIDIDRFKTINDTHGHPIGDRVLLCAANWLGKGLRHTDFIARYGGEEFAVLFRDARLAEIDARMTQVLGEIATRSFEYDQNGETKHGAVHGQRRRGRVEPGRDAAGPAPARGRGALRGQAHRPQPRRREEALPAQRSAAPLRGWSGPPSRRRRYGEPGR